MSNIVTIKHGNNPPITENLENYELGYAKSNKGLYIKDENNGIVHLNDTSKIEEDISKINNKLENVSGIVVSDTAPENTGALWIDTSNSEEPGLAKYYDSTSNQWIIISASATATWG